jgi:hypothetical protein
MRFLYLDVRGEYRNRQWEFEIGGVLFTAPTVVKAYGIIDKRRLGETL